MSCEQPVVQPFVLHLQPERAVLGRVLIVGTEGAGNTRPTGVIFRRAFREAEVLPRPGPSRCAYRERRSSRSRSDAGALGPREDTPFRPHSGCQHRHLITVSLGIGASQGFHVP